MNRLLNCISIIFLVITGWSCSSNSTNTLNCSPPGSNVQFEFAGVSTFDGIGSFDIETIGSDTLRIFGITRGCNPSNPTDSIIRIHIPYQLPDTPYTFPLVHSTSIHPNEGYVFLGTDYVSANGSFTIFSITTDSLASGYFEFNGVLSSPQLWTLYNYNTNAMDSFSLDSICLLNGTFTNVKIE